MNKFSPSIVWFRDDLRLRDHPALNAAAGRGNEILCVYVQDSSDTTRKNGAALNWWLHHALSSLRSTIEQKGGSLLVLTGDPVRIIPMLARSCGTSEVFCHYRYQREAREQDRAVAEALNKDGASLTQSHGTILRSPNTIMTAAGTPYKIFTSWWKAFRAAGPIHPALQTPDNLRFLKRPTTDADLKILDEEFLLPHKPDWSGGLEENWETGEAAALEILHNFANGPLASYETGRNDMAAEGSSRLSPYLRLGLISPRDVWHACQIKGNASQNEVFLSEIGWRDFSWYTLYHQPQLPDHNLKSQFNALRWRNSPHQLAAWQKGQTGIPIVDAGMRQLWQTGWMHNRARMITGSFLVKHLLIDWREGERWFWDTLIDADPASNAVNWQWVAGTGVDASPFFRIFNPIRQTEKFDPHGDYIRRWVPELAKLPDNAVSAPWNTDPDVLTRANVRLGKTYPRPVIALDEGRDRAMAALRATRSS